MPRRTSSARADGISPERAVAWLRALSETWRAAEVRAERADLLHAVYDRITVAGRRIVSVRLTPSAYAHGFALALPEKVVLARPTRFRPAVTHSEFKSMPIEGAEESRVADRDSASRNARRAARQQVAGGRRRGWSAWLRARAERWHAQRMPESARPLDEMKLR